MFPLRPLWIGAIVLASALSWTTPCAAQFRYGYYNRGWRSPIYGGVYAESYRTPLRYRSRDLLTESLLLGPTVDTLDLMSSSNTERARYQYLIERERTKNAELALKKEELIQERIRLESSRSPEAGQGSGSGFPSSAGGGAKPPVVKAPPPAPAEPPLSAQAQDMIDLIKAADRAQQVEQAVNAIKDRIKKSEESDEAYKAAMERLRQRLHPAPMPPPPGVNR
jgi:hypothetical protein